MSLLKVENLCSIARFTIVENLCTKWNRGTRTPGTIFDEICETNLTWHLKRERERARERERERERERVRQTDRDR